MSQLEGRLHNVLTFEEFSIDSTASNDYTFIFVQV